MKPVPRKSQRRRPPSGSSSEKSIRRGSRSLPKIESGTTSSSASNNAERPIAARPTRFWLRDDTYVDLAVPYEKIGVPFSSAGPRSALTDDEKAPTIAELRKCEPSISAGNLHVLEFT